MNEFAEVLLWCGQACLVLWAVLSVYLVGLILYERFVEGNVDAFKPERREGPPDRRAEQPSH
jgi:hypothetical protein